MIDLSLISKLEPELVLIKEEAIRFEKQIKLKEFEISRKNTIIYSIVIISIVLLVLVFILYMYYQTKKRTNEALRKKNSALAKQKK